MKKLESVIDSDDEWWIFLIQMNKFVVQLSKKCFSKMKEILIKMYKKYCSKIKESLVKMYKSYFSKMIENLVPNVQKILFKNERKFCSVEKTFISCKLLINCELIFLFYSKNVVTCFRSVKHSRFHWIFLPLKKKIGLIMTKQIIIRPF